MLSCHITVSSKENGLSELVGGGKKVCSMNWEKGVGWGGQATTCYLDLDQWCEASSCSPLTLTSVLRKRGVGKHQDGLFPWKMSTDAPRPRHCSVPSVYLLCTGVPVYLPWCTHLPWPVIIKRGLEKIHSWERIFLFFILELITFYCRGPVILMYSSKAS